MQNRAREKIYLNLSFIVAINLPIIIIIIISTSFIIEIMNAFNGSSCKFDK